MIELINGINNVLLLIGSERGVHREADAMPVILLGKWQVALLPPKLAVIGHQVCRDIMYLSKDVVLTQIFE